MHTFISDERFKEASEAVELRRKEKELNKEILNVFKDTDWPQTSGECNITFMTFLIANYSKKYVQLVLPRLYDRYYGDNKKDAEEII